MKDFFSIGQAAQIAHMTSEALRHYDRIGLVKPGRKEAATNYRYYTQQDIVRLTTVHALQQMDLPLREIKRALDYDDLEKLVAFLDEAEKKADEKIAAIAYSKAKIRLAKASYQAKLPGRRASNGVFIQELPQRMILLSDTLESPSLENLVNYLSRFYAQLPPEQKERFAFEDLAGVYTQNEQPRMFAVCTRHGAADGLRVLPEGRYLCAACPEESRESVLAQLLRIAKDDYQAAPEFTVQIIVVSGILQWQYEAQVYLGA